MSKNYAPKNESTLKRFQEVYQIYEDILEELGDLRYEVSKAYIYSIAWENMCNDSLDHGLTYSDIGNKESIIVIGLSSSAGEFLNSLIHEIHHLVSHICEYYNISLMGEESCYIAGDIALLMYPEAKRLLCNCCRESLYS